MAAIRFNARYRVTILFNGQVLMQFSSPNPNQNIDFEANIVKDAFANGNARSDIFIYNLSDDKRNTLESLITQSKNSSMQLMIEASLNNGQDQYQVVTYDDIVGVYNELGESDYKTNLITKSGEGSLVKTYDAASYPAGTKLSQILPTECQKLVDGNSIKSVTINTIIDHVFPYGWVYSGGVYAFLSKLCYENGNIMFVDNGNLTVAAGSWLNDSNPNQQDLNSFNGLLEEPHVGQNNFAKKYQQNQSSVSFTMKSLLIPGLTINGVISVLGQLYTLKRITHTIQTRQGVGYSILEGFKNASV